MLSVVYDARGAVLGCKEVVIHPQNLRKPLKPLQNMPCSRGGRSAHISAHAQNTVLTSTANFSLVSFFFQAVTVSKVILRGKGLGKG